MAKDQAGAVIINCDAMQVYRDLELITARPSAGEMDGVPHLLFGHVDGAQAYSVARWRDEVRRVLEEHPNTTPVLVGGTGLYFKVLLEGLSPMPPVDPETRETVRERCKREGSERLHAELDPETARKIGPYDAQRVCRALEVFLSTGRSLSSWQNEPLDGGIVTFDPERSIVLEAERAWLEQRIAARAELMLSENGQDEVGALIERGLSDELPVMRALGVGTVRSYLQGTLARDAAKQELVLLTRQYAKRQATWFRGQMAAWRRVRAEQIAEKVRTRSVELEF